MLISDWFCSGTRKRKADDVGDEEEGERPSKKQETESKDDE